MSANLIEVNGCMRCPSESWTPIFHTIVHDIGWPGHEPGKGESPHAQKAIEGPKPTEGK